MCFLFQIKSRHSRHFFFLFEILEHFCYKSSSLLKSRRQIQVHFRHRFFLVIWHIRDMSILRCVVFCFPKPKVHTKSARPKTLRPKSGGADLRALQRPLGGQIQRKKHSGKSAVEQGDRELPSPGDAPERYGDCPIFLYGIGPPGRPMGCAKQALKIVCCLR